MTVWFSTLAALALQSAAPWPNVPPGAYGSPLRAPLLASHCADSDDEWRGERLRAFCAGYVTAVLEMDPELQRVRCYPLRSTVIDEIVRQARAGMVTDPSLPARDLVVQAALALCRADDR